MDARTTLRNYAEDAAKGVALLAAHRTNELPLGYTFDGRFTNAQGNGVARTTVQAFIVPNLQLGYDTSSVIRGIRAGVIRELSVGFSGGKHVCSVCGRDMLRDWDCWHVPMFYYKGNDVDPEDHPRPVEADTPNAVMAFATIQDARLRELSLVYKGATPGAAVLKTARLASQGRIDSAMVAHQARQFGLTFPTKAVQGVGLVLPVERVEPAEPALVVAEPVADRAETTSQDENAAPVVMDSMSESAIVAEPDQSRAATEGDERMIKELTMHLRAAGIDLTEPDEPQVLSAVQSLIAQRDAARQEAVALLPRAKDGDQYRSDLIASALTEGVRALGNGFSESTYRAVLERADLGVVKQMRDDWQRIADAALPTGRITAAAPEIAADPAPEAQPTPTRRVVPDAAYDA
jgi:hypothetical protein